jgi:integrase
LQRLGIVFRHAVAKRLPVDSTATSNAKIILGAQRWEKKPIPSMPWREVPNYFNSLGGRTLEEALKFLILTACRSGEVRYAKWEEFNGDVWTIPEHRTKTGREHRVPLTAKMLEILGKVQLLSEGNYVFSSPRKLALSDMSMSVHMKRRGLKYRPHGFRSSFRTWAAEETNIPREICELCLGHIVGSEVELAYRRTDYLEKRRTLMKAWICYVSELDGKACSK